MKWIIVLMLGFFLCSCDFLFATGENETESEKAVGETQVWVENWRVNTFQDSLAPENASLLVNLTVAKNSVEPFQINLRPSIDGEITTVIFSDLIAEDNSTISATNISYQFVDFIRSRTNSRYNDATDSDAVLGDWGIKWVNVSNPVRKTSTADIVAFPEILSNDGSTRVKKGMTQPIWIKVRIPKGTQATKYLGEMQVKTTFGDFTIPIDLTVKDVTIPDSDSKDAFSLEIWSQLVGNFDTTIDVVEDAFGVKVGSADWWTIMKSFADLMKENRLNVLTVNQTALLLQGENTTVDADGTVHFDWSFFNEFISFFKEHAGIQRFAFGHLAQYKANPVNWNNDVVGQTRNDYTKAFVDVLIRGDDGKPQIDYLDVNLSAHILGKEVPALLYVEQYAKSMNENVTSMGWKDLFYHHIIDEPGKDQQASLYPILEEIIDENTGGMPTGDAFTVWTAEEQSPHTEIFSVMLSSLEEVPDRMMAALKPNDNLWIYTSVVPMKDNYLNRAIDQPTWFMEMIGWLSHKRGASGYLHWGLNQWNTWTTNYVSFPNYPQDEMWDKVMGDPSSVYPDKKNLAIRSSIRVEALREASELTSILKIAQQKNPALTTQLTESMIRSGKEYETDINKITQAKVIALEIAAGESPDVN